MNKYIIETNLRDITVNALSHQQAVTVADELDIFGDDEVVLNVSDYRDVIDTHDENEDR